MQTLSEITPEALRERLRKKFLLIVEAYKKLSDASRELAEISGKRESGSGVEEHFQEVYQSTLDNVLEVVSREKSGIGGASLQLHNFDSIDHRIWHVAVDDRNDWLHAKKGLPIERNTAYAEAIVREFPAEAFVEELNQQASELENTGLQGAADQIIERLYLNCRWAHNIYTPKRNKSGFSFFTNLYRDSIWGGYDYHNHEAIRALMDALDVFAAESGVEGITSSTLAIRAEFPHGTQREAHPSRTKLTAGMAIEAITFKEKLELRFSHDDADALIAFLRLNGTKDMRVLDEMADAA